MTWNDRWETKLFLEGHGTARRNGVKCTTSIKFSLLDAIKRFTPTLNRKLLFIFFLIFACIQQFAQHFLMTFNFLAILNL